MDGNKIMPLAIFAVIWLLAARELLRGVGRGEITEYRRGEGSRTCVREKEPISFAFLFIFYFAVAIGVPALVCSVISDGYFK